MNKNDIMQYVIGWCKENNSYSEQNLVVLDLKSLRDVVGLCINKARDQYIPRKRLECWEQKVEKLDVKLKEYKEDRASLRLLRKNLSKNIGW